MYYKFELKVSDNNRIVSYQPQSPEEHDALVYRIKSRTCYMPRASAEKIAEFDHVCLTGCLLYYDHHLIRYNADLKAFTLAIDKNVIVFADGTYDTRNQKFLPPILSMKTYLHLQFNIALALIQHYISSMDKPYIENNVVNTYPCIKTNAAELINFNATVEENNMLEIENRIARQRIFGVLHKKHGISRDIIIRLIKDNRFYINKELDLGFIEYETDQHDYIVNVTKYSKSFGYTNFDAMVTRCDRTFTLKNYMESECRNVMIFESIISMLSYFTLAEKNIMPPISPNTCCISLNGRSIYSLRSFLNENKKVEKIIVCLNNTSESQATVKDFKFDKIKIENQNNILAQAATESKDEIVDWNDLLKISSSIHIGNNETEQIADCNDESNVSALKSKDDKIKEFTRYMPNKRTLDELIGIDASDDSDLKIVELTDEDDLPF